MSLIKTPDQIAEIKKAGVIVKRVLDVMGAMATPGTNCLDMSATAENIIKHMGGVAACKGYRGFPSPLCLSINACVLHGIPTSYCLKDGDLVTADLSVSYNGWLADAAKSFQVGKKTDVGTQLIKACDDALAAALAEVKDGVYTMVLSARIWQTLVQAGVRPATGFGGHGIGQEMHMPPFIANNPIDSHGTTQLHAGEVVCIEPTAMVGNGQWVLGEDKWSVIAKDGGLTAHSESCILVKENGYEILT